MPVILVVRVTSALDAKELERRALERKPQFEKVPGLIQKFYGMDKTTGNVCGVYLFKDHASLVAYRESQLAKTIPTAYEATEVRPEAYELMFSLHPGRGPIDE